MKTQVLVLISLLFVLGMVSPALGQMMHGNIGVANGATFSYSYTCYFDSDAPNFSPPPDFGWINQTGYYMMDVTGISGDTVNYDTTLHMTNGTNISGIGYMNMNDGSNSMSGYNPMGIDTDSYYFMSSNVGMRGRMYPSSSNGLTINDTFTMNYPDGPRTINHMSLIVNQNGVTNHTDYYFDQATGAMVEWRQQYIQTNGNLQANSTQLMQLNSSSVWTVPEFPALLIIPFLCAMTVLVLFITLRKKNALAAMA